MALGYAWFDSYDSVGYVLTLNIFPPYRSDRGDGEVVATMCGMGVGDHPWPLGHVSRERA